MPHCKAIGVSPTVREVLRRFYVRDMEGAVCRYEKITGEKCSRRFSYPEAELEIAQVGNILLITGTDEALAPFRETVATFIVTDIEYYRKVMLLGGSTVVRDIKDVPTGRNMTLLHPDGIVIEYVEYK
ncbi:MAG: VOC family protein [Rikenellaceae bacterium]|nr:VOC family protein [Rikenellaceae bacterium]